MPNELTGMKALKSWVPWCSVLQWLTHSCTALSHVPPAPEHGSSPGSQALMKVSRFSFNVGKYFILTKQQPYFLYLYTKEITGICVSSVFIYTGFCLTRNNRNLNLCSYPTTAECLDFFLLFWKILCIREFLNTARQQAASCYENSQQPDIQQSDIPRTQRDKQGR